MFLSNPVYYWYYYYYSPLYSYKEIGGSVYIYDFLFGSAIRGRGGVALLRLASSLLRTRPIFADLVVYRAAVLRLCSSSPPVSSGWISIMVDILMLMFFAIVGLVFLSYIIYLLWCSSSEPLSRTHRMTAFTVLPHWFLAWSTVRKRYLILPLFNRVLFCIIVKTKIVALIAQMFEAPVPMIELHKHHDIVA